MATSIAAPSQYNLLVNEWTNVYNSAPVAGFSGTVRIVVEVAVGTTIKLANNATGVTAIAQGYDSLYDGTATSMAFEGSLAQVNLALQSLQAFNTDAAGSGALQISAVKAGSAYNPDNGHYYQAINYSGGIGWLDAKTAAASEPIKFNGLQGYLATITSAKENEFILNKLPADAWMGATDKDSEGHWKWDTGPETGQEFWYWDGSAGVTVSGRYNNWNSNEPNNSSSHTGSPEGEDYGQFYVSGGSPGKWNDLPGAGADPAGKLNYYVVEYGGMTGDAPTEAAASSSSTLTVQARPVITSNSGDTPTPVSYAENGIGAVTIVTATDADTGDSKTYSISGGADAGLFDINSGTGALTFKVAPDYEGTGDNSYEVKVKVTDSANLFDEQTLTVIVTDVNDHAPVFTSGGTGSVAENALTSTVIYQAVSTDADGTPANRNVAYSLKSGQSDDAALLSINSSTGEVTLNASANYEVKNSYAFTVVATNAGSGATLSVEQAVTASVADVNDLPAITAGTTTAFTEQTPTAVAPAITLSDEDGNWTGGTLKVQITANASADDSLSLPTANPGGSGIWLDGTTLKAGSTEIGSASDASVSGGTAWTFTFNAAATNAFAQDLAQAVQFTNNSDHPDITSRTVTFTASDAVSASASATQTVSVTAVNDAPVLANAGDSNLLLITVAEGDTSSSGSLISSLVRAVDGSNPTDNSHSVVTDGDYNVAATGVAWDGGVAIYGLSSTGPADGGKWQYKLGSGTWTDVGTVSETSALLLASADSIRFVPDEKNATTATFSYYLWDGASGTAGNNKVGVSTRGGSTAFSTAGDVATITVSAVNDAPTLDLDSNDSSTATGTGFTTVFRPLGQSVALVDTDVLIADVDKLDSTHPDTLTSAKVFIASGALNNIGTTKYETLSSTAGTSFTSSHGVVITIGGNGTSSSSPLTLTGAGSWVDYQEALQTLRYQNSSDSSVAGNRSISISVTDAANTTGGTGQLESLVATSTVQVVWAPVQDLNGSGDGKGYSTTYVEDSAGIPIAAANAVINSGEKVKSLVATLKNPLDGTSGDAESLFIDTETVATLTGVGFAIAGNGTHTLTLTGELDKSLYGTALQAIQYKNSSQNPSVDPRAVEVSVTDTNNQAGAPVVSTINITSVNDAPSAITLSDTAIALTDTGIDTSGTASSAVEVAIVAVTDVDSGTHTLSVGGTDAALFAVSNGKLYLKAGTKLDPAAQPSYAISLSANDGQAVNNTTTQDFTINVTEAVAPVFSIAAVNGNTLTLYYQDSSRLDHGKVPDKSAFTVSGGYTVNSVAIPNDTSKTVVLTLNTAPTGAIKVGYTPPGTNPVQDTSGNKAASLASVAVTTATVSTSPSLTVTTTDGGTVPAPLGDFTLVNNGTAAALVSGVQDKQTVTLTGTGPTTLSDPAGNLSVVNNGSGTVTVDGLNTDATLTTSGSGPTQVTNPDGNLSLANNGTETVSVSGFNSGAILNSSGTGPTTISNPEGSLSVGNTGTGLLTVSGDLAGDTVSIDGTGTGPVAIDNTGSTAVTVASVNDGQTISTTGSGPSQISNPDGSLSVGNTGTGLVTISGDLAGDTVTIAGTGTGPVAIDNSGSTAVTVASVNDGQTISTTGSGPSQISNPDGSLSVGNTGTGLVAVSGDLAGDTVTIAGTGTGPVAIDNTGSSAVTVASVNNGQIIATTGTGPTKITNPDGNLTVANSGTGAITVEGLKPDAVLQTTGDKIVNIDLSHLASGQTITIDNDGSGVVNLVNVPEGVTVLTTGSSGTGGINYAPTISGVPGTAQGVTAGATAALADFKVADKDASNTLTVTLTPSNGSIGGLTDVDTNTPGIQLTGAPSAINTALAGATFTASTAGAAGFAISVSDGVAAPAKATYSFTASNSPSGQPDPTPAPTQAPTKEDGATLTTGTTTTSDGRTWDVVTVTPISENRQEQVGDVTRADIAMFYGDAQQNIPTTTASLPTGVGLVSTGARTPTSDAQALQDLITLVNKTAGTTESNRVEMETGSRQFLEGLAQQADKGPLIVNSVKLTVAPGQTTAPDLPITITGSISKVSQGSGNGGAPVEAIVIDTRALPPGTVLELNDIEFAVIVGDHVTIRGGQGANIVFAGSGPQNIVLGEDNDELHGGDGDDVVGSAAGADLIFGNAGNDVVFGGAGADLLHGGGGNDVATYSGNMANYEITRDHGKTIVRSLDRLDDIDTLLNVETIRFDDQSYTVENNKSHTWIASLYNEVLDRQAEIGGFQHWSGEFAAGKSLGNVALNFLVSAEHNANIGQAFSELSKGQQVDLFYQYFLGREAEQAGHNYWVDILESGYSLEIVAQLFMESVEMQGKYLQPNQWDFSL